MPARALIALRGMQPRPAGLYVTGLIAIIHTNLSPMRQEEADDGSRILRLTTTIVNWQVSTVVRSIVKKRFSLANLAYRRDNLSERIIRNR